MIKVFIWVGRDQMQRLQAHERVLLDDITALPCGGSAPCPLRQIRPQFYYSDDFDAAVNGDIYGNVQIRFDDYIH